MPLPNFFLIGAPKSGTTALYHALKQHPEIYMGEVKEPYYFAFNGSRPNVQPGPAGTHLRRVAVWQPRDYLLLYAGGTNHRVIGDATPLYLRSPEAAHGIKAAAPKSKIAAILRQPAERAYSNYLYMVEKGVSQAGTFQEALASEPMKIKQGCFSGLYHKQNGFYHEQLIRYYELFPREQIRVYLYEDWNEAPHEMLQDLFQFLGVDPRFQPMLRRSNVTLVPRSRRLHHLARHPEMIERKLKGVTPERLRRMLTSLVTRMDTRYNLAPPPPLDPEIRRSLTEDYRQDILRLQELIERDLSHWLKKV